MKKRQVLPLCWFAAQQQTSTFRRQKKNPFYLKFRAELNKLAPRLQKQPEMAQKLLKPRFGFVFCCEICECTLSYLKMVANIINKIVSQNELPITLTVEISHEAQIEGHHVYKDIWAPELSEHLEVQCEPENHVDKYAVYLKTSNGTIAVDLKKGKSGRFAKTVFHY